MEDIEFRSLDLDKINIHEYYEVEYWSKQFDLHPSMLISIVKNSGITSASALRNYLDKYYGESAA